MDTRPSQLDSTPEHHPPPDDAFDELTDAEAARLLELASRFLLPGVPETQKEARREILRSELQQELIDAGDPLAAVWAHAAAKGYYTKDTKYRVLLDLLIRWVDQANSEHQLVGFTQLERLGAGGFGVVYQATQQLAENQRKVAIKLPYVSQKKRQQKRAEMIRPEERYLLAAIRSFIDEVGKLIALPDDLPNCVRIYDASLPESKRIDAILLHLLERPICYWMRFVDGQSLHERMGDRYEPGKTIPTPTVMQWMEQIAEALRRLHELGIIHKDLKPANILIDGSDNPWITDFGLAANRFDQSVFGNPSSGTPLYMAPEQWNGHECNAQTDIWAWGAIFHEVSTGTLPFGDNRHELRDRVINAAVDSPTIYGVDQHLSRIIKRCLKKNRTGDDARYESFAEVLDDLRLGTAGIRPRQVSAAERLEAVLDFLERLALNGLKENVVYLPPKLKPDEGEADKPESRVTVHDLVNFCLPVQVVDEQQWQRLESERSSPGRSLISRGPDDRDYIFAQSEEFWRMDGERRATPRRLQSVLATNRRVVLRGEPGEGKTTSLFLHVAHQCRELAEGLRNRKFGLVSPECRVPLPLPLSKAAPTESSRPFSAIRRAQNEALRIAYESVKKAPPEVTEWLKEKVSRGEIDLYLDALDELDVRWHESLRKELERDDPQRQSEIGVFLTTRLSADDTKVIRNAHRYRMVCFGPAQVRDYITRYFSHVENGEQLARELRGQLRLSPGPRHLAQIPLLLALLCEWLASRWQWPIERIRQEIPKTRTKLLGDALHRLMERGDARRNNPVADPPSERNQIKEAVLRHVAWRFFATGPLPIVKHDLMPVLEQQLERPKWKGYAPPQNAEALLEEYLQDGVFVRQDQGVYRFVLRSLHEFCLAGWIANESPPIIANDRVAFEGMIRGRADLWSNLASRTGDVKPLNQPAWENIWPYVLEQLGPKTDWLLEALWSESQKKEDIHSSRLLLLARAVGRSNPHWQHLDEVVTRLIRIVEDNRRHGDLALCAVEALADLEADRAQEFLSIVVNHRGGRSDDQRFPTGDQRLPIAAYRGVVQHNRSKTAQTDYFPPTLAEAIVSLGSHTLGFGDEFGRIVAEIGDEEHWHALLALIRCPATTGEIDIDIDEQRLHLDCAIAIVRGYGNDAIDTLVTMMNDNAFPVWSRRNLAVAIATNGDDRALPILEQWMNEARKLDDIAWPGHAIAKLGTEAAVTFLLRFVTDQSESRSNRTYCAQVLRDTCDERARTTLLSLLRNLSEQELHLTCVHAFGHALGHVKQPELHETLMRVVCIPRYHDVVRGCCASLLATHKARAALDIIFEQMSESDTSEYLRIEFAIALGNLGDKRALEWLAKYLLSPTIDTYKRGKIADALAAIGGQSARDILIDAISEDGRWQGMESQVAWYCAWALADIADEAAWTAVVRQFKIRDGDEGCRHALDLMGRNRSPTP